MAKKRGNGEGSITRRKDGRWMGRVTTDTGRKTVYGRTRSEVAEKINQLINDINKGTYVEASKILVKDWILTWFRDYVLPIKRPSTARGYDDIIRLYLIPCIGHIALKDLRPDHIQKMINNIQRRIPKNVQIKIAKLEKRLDNLNDDEQKALISQEIANLKERRISARTIQHIIVMLGTALSQAVKNGLITKNVAKDVILPKVEEKEIQFLTLEEQKKFQSVLSSHRYGFVFEFDLATGLRQSELLGLRWEDVDFEKGCIKVKNTIMRQRKFDEEGNRPSGNETKTEIIAGKPKTKKGIRTIPLPPSIITKLKKHEFAQQEEKKKLDFLWQENGLVFTSEIGTNIEPRRMLDVFHRLLKEAGLQRRGIHALRHTFATRAIENGVDVKTLSELLGHEDVTTTLNLYVHSSEQAKQESMQKLNYLFNENDPEND